MSYVSPKTIEEIALQYIGHLTREEIDPGLKDTHLRLWELQLRASLAYAGNDRAEAERFLAEAARSAEGLEPWQLLAPDAPHDVVEAEYQKSNRREIRR